VVHIVATQTAGIDRNATASVAVHLGLVGSAIWRHLIGQGFASLGWKATVRLRDGLASTYQWLLAHRAKRRGVA
jgi:hypothetical protein